MTAINLDLLVQGDAFDIVKEIPDNYADCICIDPPYGISYYSGYYKGKNPHKKISPGATIDGLTGSAPGVTACTNHLN